MNVVGDKIELRESPFDFDVWCCPECTYVVTIEGYKEALLDLACGGCGRTTLSEYNLWPGKRDGETEH